MMTEILNGVHRPSMVRIGIRSTLAVLLVGLLSVLVGPTQLKAVPSRANLAGAQAGLTWADGLNSVIYLPVVHRPGEQSWPMLAANPQRTSWTPEEVRGDLYVEWYRPIEPYIPYKIQPIAANGKLYISTARGLYTLSANDGSLLWIYPTELPLGHSPTVTVVNNKNVVFVGGYDHRIHAIDGDTGQPIAGYTPYEAGAGFETNPLVVNDAYTGYVPTIFAGNRDGNFYALNAVDGSLRWKYQTNGPILFSAAYQEGVVYFASNDAYAYALNVSNGSLKWKSAKLPGAGFHSFWPVIFPDNIGRKVYVVFTGGENYRNADGIGITHGGAAQTHYDSDYLFPCGLSCAWGTPLGPQSTAPNDGYWTPGTRLIYVGKITSYLESYPYRRTVFVLDGDTGQEFTFDSDNDGKREYAPFTWSGVTHSGNKYPPLVNGIDGIYYQNTAYVSAPWISRADAVGWKLGTPFVSRVMNVDVAHAIDEPMAYSSGGRLIYWQHHGDDDSGSFDVTIPYGQPDRSWHFFSYGDLPFKAPNYSIMYAANSGPRVWQVYGTNNGIYGKHGTTQSPPIPYQGRLYYLKGNAIIAFGPTQGSPVGLPLAATVPVQNAPTAPTTNELKQRLEGEIQKMLAAGHLRPGYFSAGFMDWFGQGMSPDPPEYGEVFDYFQNPAETVVTLLQALPFLSSPLQQQVRTYLQTNYGPGAPYSIISTAHVGWKTGAAREVFAIPPDIWNLKFANFGIRTGPNCNYCGYWTSFPPYSFYAAWKYAVEFGGAKSIFDQMSGKLNSPPSDSYLITNPYMLNQYIAGYLGYLRLQVLAGYSQNPTVANTYNRLLNLRVANFSKDAPWGYSVEYRRAFSISRNFMYLTTELADHLNQTVYAKAQAAIAEYSWVAPYWFVSKFDNSVYEGTHQPLYDYAAMFQAKAYVLKQPYSELVKWLDVPAFYRGDLFYIQNVVAALSASSGP